MQQCYNNFFLKDRLFMADKRQIDPIPAGIFIFMPAINVRLDFHNRKERSAYILILSIL